ncbi:FtsK/SpoIIIE domain-containing protein [Streptomyces sp. NPDC048272]|uniref:FtsK/SpoIIIE domain-containing protein n=1 Tax=Streptomyces sp. NPDC048272 TaxID=3154616 RepID=UPI003441EF6E
MSMSTAAQQPRLTLVPDQPAALEGTVVTKPSKDIAKAAAPAWLGAAVNHAKDNRLYLPIVGRGYRSLGRHWADRYADDFPHMIETVRQELREAPADKQAGLKKLKKDLRSEYRQHRLVHLGLTGAWTLAGGTGLAVGTLTGGLWVDLAAALGAYLVGLRHGVGDEPQPLSLTLPAQVETCTAHGNPTAPANDEPELRQILAQLGFPNITIVDNPPMNPDGTRSITFDLGGTGTVTELRKKTEGLAGALKRDLTMVDVDKVPGNAGRASLWTSNVDPFEAARPSPLLTNPQPIDAFADGVPVGWTKRGTTIRLPIRNSHFLIGGTTRSGKGVGMANLMAGAALDARINLRLAAGKENGEFDAYAKAGVAATYFKPNPKRLLALLDALLADMDRRNRILGRLGKSKMVPATIDQLGGIELVVIDELATFTAKNSHEDRDVLLEKLMNLAAVSAGAGILLVLTTQLPQVDVVPSRLSMNCLTKWAMKVDSAGQSNTILGDGQAGAGRDASSFDPPRPGLGWMANPFAGITDLARSFDLDEDERGEVTQLMGHAVPIRRGASRLAGQWDDPIESYLLNATGLSSAAGGPKSDGVPGRYVTQLTGEQRLQLDAIRGALAAMDQLGRDAATTTEMAQIIGGGMTAEKLGALLRAGGAGGTDKVKIGDDWPRGYKRADIAEAESFLSGS